MLAADFCKVKQVTIAAGKMYMATATNYRHLITSIEIEATPAQVWSVLTDFASFPSWSAFIRRVDGVAALGAGLVVELQPVGMKPSVFKPVVVTCEAEREFAWLGKLGWGGLFDGEHRFVLEPLPDGGTRLIHSERFGGLLVPLLKKMLTGPTAAGFAAFNVALRVEVGRRFGG